MSPGAVTTGAVTPVPPDGRVLVVGGSIAAATAARALRGRGHTGPVTLVSGERHPPYARPPLSKGVLTGTEEPGSAQLPDLADVELRLGVPAAGLDVAARRVTLADGTTLDWDGLVVATGARARTIPGAEAAGARTLRDLDDARELGALVRGARSVVVVGGGPLGMEVASVARDLGARVTLVSDVPPLRALMGDHVSRLLVAAAEAAGVTVVTEPVRELLARDGGGTTAVLASGHRVEGDAVLVAVGCRPNVEWLAGSGLDVGPGGLVVDEFLRAGPGVVAAGDVVAHPHPVGALRTPYWSNAVDQAMAAVDALVEAEPAPFRARPYFWTEQFGHSVKLVGALPDVGEPEEVASAAGTVLRWRGPDGVPTGVAAIDCPLSVPRLRRLLAAG
ncbi:NAD(P)/FAD-dependent oxidoreductase [Modestobacter versicolor]|uniref:NAD(P)/FAD-dependent oxidoreductase n=1 Tax=Modestobacter versicolor TaxID=429133 RepID=UPI0034DE2EEE